MFKVLILSLFLYSCASMSSDWSPWQMDDVDTMSREWHFCNEELDGPELHQKGICYQSEECRTRRTIFGNKKKECRRLPLFCAHGDIECLNKYGINVMTISNKK